MKKVVSKRNGKTYYKTVANFRASANNKYAFYNGETYWVRKADEFDQVDPEEFVMVKGTFFCDLHYWELMFSHDPVSLANGYNGTYVFDFPVKKSTVRNVLSYVD